MSLGRLVGFDDTIEESASALTEDDGFATDVSIWGNSVAITIPGDGSETARGIGLGPNVQCRAASEEAFACWASQKIASWRGMLSSSSEQILLRSTASTT